MSANIIEDLERQVKQLEHNYSSLRKNSQIEINEVIAAKEALHSKHDALQRKYLDDTIALNKQIRDLEGIVRDLGSNASATGLHETPQLRRHDLASTSAQSVPASVAEIRSYLSSESDSGLDQPVASGSGISQPEREPAVDLIVPTTERAIQERPLVGGNDKPQAKGKGRLRTPAGGLVCYVSVPPLRKSTSRVPRTPTPAKHALSSPGSSRPVKRARMASNQEAAPFPVVNPTYSAGDTDAGSAYHTPPGGIMSDSESEHGTPGPSIMNAPNRTPHPRPSSMATMLMTPPLTAGHVSTIDPDSDSNSSIAYVASSLQRRRIIDDTPLSSDSDSPVALASKPRRQRRRIAQAPPTTDSDPSVEVISGPTRNKTGPSTASRKRKPNLSRTKNVSIPSAFEADILATYIGAARPFPILPPPPKSFYIPRMFIQHTYGGSSYQFVQIIPEQKNPSSTPNRPRKRRMVFPLPDLNPCLPKRPGEPGFLFASRHDTVHDPPWCLFIQHTKDKATVWEYLGGYKSIVCGKISADQFTGQTPKVKEQWAKLIRKTIIQDVYVSMRARIALRLHRHAVDDDSVIYEMGRIRDHKGLDVSLQEINDAFCRGDEAIDIIRLECVEYDRTFVDDMVTQHKEWDSPAARELRRQQKADSTGKAKGPARPRLRRRVAVAQSDDGDDRIDEGTQPETFDASQRRILGNNETAPRLESPNLSSEVDDDILYGSLSELSDSDIDQSP